MSTTIGKIAKTVRDYIARGDKAAAEAKRHEASAQERREIAERMFRAAGYQLIKLHKQCEQDRVSFAKAVAEQVKISRSRAYELMNIVGGIPEKVKARTIEETRAKTAARFRKHYQSVRYKSNLTDNSGTVIPWPKEIKRPAPNSEPMGEYLTGKDAEELAGRFLNVIQSAEAMTTYVEDLSKLIHFRVLAKAARRTAEAWNKIAAELERMESNEVAKA